MMRRQIYYTLCLFFILLSSSSLFAQTDPEFKRTTKSKYKVSGSESTEDTETIIAVDSGVFLGYGSMALGACKLKSALIGCYGVQGVWVMQEKYLIGLDLQGGRGQAEKLKPKSLMPSEGEGRAEFTQVSLLLGTIVNTHKAFHPVFSVLIGQSKVSYDDLNGLFIPDYYYKEAKFFMVEPIAEYEINFTKYVRFSGGISMKIPLSQPDNRDFKAEDVFGPRFFIAFKAGGFRY